ncbi:DUF2092 domain-containing protein [Candidatus Accumulibacter aalborgensis]|nr:DUF2092 domain-containing protein [Candidatus Accumulibacter aalborgensis]
MIPGKFVGRAALLALGIALAAGANAQQSLSEARSQRARVPSKAAAVAPKPELEAKAIDVLKATTDRLAKAQSMSFTAIVTYESPSRIGPALAYTTISEVVMQRPDKLRVVTLGDGPASEFYYDGKTMTAFAPAENLVAVSAAPPTIDAALKAAFDRAAIYFPFTDLVVADPYKALAEGLTVAFYIGQSKVIGGTTTDMVALVNDNVFLQVWIGAEDKLPRMLRAVFRNDPLRLRHQMELSNWKLDPVVAADTFASAKAATALPMAFAHPGGSAASGFRPPTKAKPAGKAAAKPQPTKTP